MTVAEVAAILKLNQQTVGNMIDRGELPAVRIGQRRVRIKRSDFDAFVEAGYSGKRPSAPPSIWEGEGEGPLPDVPSE